MTTTNRRLNPGQATRSIVQWLDAHFDDLVIVIMAGVAVLTALAAFLQSRASNHAATQIRQSQALAMEAMAQDTSSRQRESYDFDLYTTWNEWDWRRARAESYDPVLAARAAEIVNMIAPLSPLLDENQPYYNPDTRYSDLVSYHADMNLYTTTLILEQRTFVLQAARSWSGQADRYVTILTLLAVSLFLFGLSTSIKGKSRYLFPAVGAMLILVSLAWLLALTLSPVRAVPPEAITAYARGRSLAYSGKAAEARASFDAAVAAFPGYGNAYAARGRGWLDEGKYQEAIQDYRQAVRYGRDDSALYWDLGWTCYLAGDYEAALEANRRALELDPGLFPIVMNNATTLLVQGKMDAAMEEYEHGLALAAVPTSGLPSSWSHLYVRETINDLDRLVDTLDGKDVSYQKPMLDHVADPTALRQAAEAARRRLKEGIVAIETSGTPLVQPTTAELGPLTVGRTLGLNGKLLGMANSLPRGVMSAALAVPYVDLPEGAIVSRRVLYWAPGSQVQYLPTMGEDIRWSGPTSGTMTAEMWSPWPGSRGLRPGTFRIEYYVNGNLLQSQDLAVPAEDEPIVGPVVLSPENASTGVPAGASGIFPAGISQLQATFSYSGLDESAPLSARWYRNGFLYRQGENTASVWGDMSFYLYDVPEGDYRFELYSGEQLVQSVDFQVLDVESYRQAIGQEPEGALFQRILGEAYAYAGMPDQATIRFQKAVELDPNCIDCYHHWWSLLVNQGQYDEAVEKIRRAVELNPNEYAYLCNMGDTYYQAGDDDQAVDAYRRAVPLAPASVYNTWGNSFFSLERYDEAVVKYQQAIELEPGNATFYGNLGGAYKALGRDDEAIAAYQQAVEVDPAYDRAYNEWGLILYNQGRYAEAAEQFEKAAEAAPSNAVYYGNLGLTYEILEQYSDAEAAFEQATTIDPGYAWAYNSWGDVLYEQRRYAEAGDKYVLAIDADPSDPLYHFNLGMAYYQQGQDAEAIAEFEQAAEQAGNIGDTELQQNAETMLARLR